MFFLISGKFRNIVNYFVPRAADGDRVSDFSDDLNHWATRAGFMFTSYGVIIFCCFPYAHTFSLFLTMKQFTFNKIYNLSTD